MQISPAACYCLSLRPNSHNDSVLKHLQSVQNGEHILVTVQTGDSEVNIFYLLLQYLTSTENVFTKYPHVTKLLIKSIVQ